jgi:hypothetical protein
MQFKHYKQIHFQQSNNRARKQQLIPVWKTQVDYWLKKMRNKKNVGFKMSLCNSVQKSTKNIGNF